MRSFAITARTFWIGNSPTHAWFSGCQLRPIPTADGILRWREIERAIRPRDPAHNSATAAISLEHAHNMGGGTLYPLEEIDAICDRAHERGMKVHMDGARIFNAVAASGVPAARIASKLDTVMFCLSKGLGAPVGSMLAGTAEAIARGRVFRKSLGGGMRQAGVLAAAGLIALEEMRARLAEDHANARLIAEGVARLPGVTIDPAKIVTNIVIFEVARPLRNLSQAAKTRGVLLSGVGGQRVRAVTHFDVSRKDCEQAVEAIAGQFKSELNSKRREPLPADPAAPTLPPRIIASASSFIGRRRRRLSLRIRRYASSSERL